MKGNCRRDNVLSFLVIALYVAIQGVTLTASWFPADDMQELTYVRNIGSCWQLLGNDAFGLFRPMKNLLFVLFSCLEKCDMLFVRVAAIAVGAMTFLPVREFFKTIFGNGSRALFATAIWMLAPTLVSSVAWLSCVNIQLMCGFAAGAFVLHDRGKFVGTSLLLILACLCYELAVVMGPCLVAFDYFLRPSRMHERRARVAYVGYAVAILAFLFARHCLGSAHSVNGSFANCTRLDLVFASAYFAFLHFHSWLLPFGRMAVMGGYVAGSVPFAVLASSWVVLLGLIVAAFFLRRRQPIIAFGLAVAMLGFVPVSNITGVGNGPYGDYYLGISSFGFAALTTACCAKRFPCAVIVAVRSVAIVSAFHWAYLWCDGIRAYCASIENFPDFFANRQLLASRLYSAGLKAEAIDVGRDVEEFIGTDSGQMAGIYIMRGLYALDVKRDAKEALLCFVKSRKNSDLKVNYCNRDYYLGCVYERLLCDTNRAEKLYSSALRSESLTDRVRAADNLALIKADRGELNDAISLWEWALKLKADDAAVRHNLDIALAKLNSFSNKGH